jgi:arylsulfatase A-like enzyme
MPGKRFQGRSKAGWYGDFVVQVDDAVGQVMAALKRRGLEKNTLVVLTSDNGAHWTPADIARFGHRSNMDWRGQKADIYEAGHRVPFLVRWPGRVEVGKVSDRLVCLLDLYRTFAESAGVPVPSGQGEDSYTILGAPASRPAAVIHHSGNGVFAIREGDWKLILGLGSGGFTMPREETPVPGGPMGQLYNLREDPGELRNLYKERPGVVARLERLLAQIQSGEGR